MNASQVITKLGRPIAYYPSLSEAIGSNTAGIFLCQMLYWHDRSQNDGWVYKTMEEIKKETGLSRKEQISARKLLTSLGLLEENYERLKHRMFYRINLARFDEWFDNSLATPSGQNEPGGETPENDMGISPCTKRELRDRPKGNFGTDQKGTSYKEQRLHTEITNIDIPPIVPQRGRPPTKQSSEDLQILEEMVDAWNTFAARNGFPQVQQMTDKRKKAAGKAAKIVDSLGGMEGWHSLLDKISASEFLTNQFRPGFDWVIKGDNYVKIAEGNYDKARPKSQSDKLKEVFRERMERIQMREARL
jgi:hypothetical protein